MHFTVSTPQPHTNQIQSQLTRLTKTYIIHIPSHTREIKKMATKLKNIPALNELKSLFIYIDSRTDGGALSAYEGRLYPTDLYFDKSTNFVKAIFDEGESLFCMTQDATRYIKIKGHRMPEDKLIWYYHKGKYPMTAMDHVNGDLLDSRIENIKPSGSVRKNAAEIKKNKLAQAGRIDAQELQNKTPQSGVVGIYYTTSQHNAYMWKVEYITNTVKEVPCDEHGNVIDFRSKGWYKRKTKLIRKRSKTFLGFYVTLDEAKRALRLHTNEVRYGVCRWHTDNKIKTLCTMIRDTKGGTHEGVYAYINMLSYREVLPLGDVSEIADRLGFNNRPLQVKESA